MTGSRISVRGLVLTCLQTDAVSDLEVSVGDALMLNLISDWVS